MFLFATIFIFNFYIINDLTQNPSSGFYVLISAYFIFSILPKRLNNNDLNVSINDKIFVTLTTIAGMADLAALIQVYMGTLKQ